MKKSLRKAMCILLLFLLIIATGCQSSIKTSSFDKAENMTKTERFRLVESDGTELVFDNKPERIIVMSVATAEIMHALGIPLAGRTSTSRELSEGLRNLPELGIPMQPDMEKIAALNPDLVIMSSTFKAAHEEKFKNLGINTYFIDNQRYTDTQKSIEILAKAFNKEEKAKDLLKPIKERESALLEKIKGKHAPKVIVMFGTSDSFSMARGNSFVGEMVKFLGAKNLADQVKVDKEMATVIPLSIEQIVEFNPEVILRVSHGHPVHVQRLYEKEFTSNPAWHNIDAVKNGRVYDLETQLFFANPGLTAIDALEELAKILYE